MLWTPTRHARDARRTAGFVLPCQPTLVEPPPEGDGWLHGVKFDGYRLVARNDGRRVRLWTRHATSFTADFPRIAAAVAALPVDQIRTSQHAGQPRVGHASLD